MGNAGVVSTTRGLADVLSPLLSEYTASCRMYWLPGSGLTKLFLYKHEMELIFDTLRASYSVQTVPCQPVSCTIAAKLYFK